MNTGDAESAAGDGASQSGQDRPEESPAEESPENGPEGLGELLGKLAQWERRVGQEKARCAAQYDEHLRRKRDIYRQMDEREARLAGAAAALLPAVRRVVATGRLDRAGAKVCRAWIARLAMLQRARLARRAQTNATLPPGAARVGGAVCDPGGYEPDA